VAPEFVPETFYGQLQHIFVVKMPAARSDLGLAKRETLILAVIQTCNIERHDSLDMHYYKRQGAIEVVDITSVQCLVGRIKDKIGGQLSIVVVALHVQHSILIN